MGALLYTVALVLVALWVIGLVVHVTFAAIHLLLVLAIVLVIWNLVMANRSRSAG